MNEYINKEYIRNIVQHHWDYTCGAECFAYGRVLDDIDAAPVTEIKHGRWYLADNLTEIVCSECDENFDVFSNELGRFKYCPNCGVYMREMYGDKNEND